MLTSLDPKDLHSVLTASDLIMQSCSLDELRQRSVETFASIVPCTLVAWNEVDLAVGQIEAVTSSPVEDRRDLDEAFIAHVDDHPVIRQQRQTGDERPMAISDYTELTAFRNTGIYADFYRYLEAVDQISFLVPAEGSMIAIAINRDTWGISPRDLTICSLLRPLVAQTYRLISRTAQLEGLLSLRSREQDDSALVRRFRFTAREVEVMRCVANGMSTKRIASSLGISPRTVDKHVGRAVAKLGASTRLEAIAALLTMDGEGEIKG